MVSIITTTLQDVMSRNDSTVTSGSLLRGDFNLTPEEMERVGHFLGIESQPRYNAIFALAGMLVVCRFFKTMYKPGEGELSQVCTD